MKYGRRGMMRNRRESVSHEKRKGGEKEEAEEGRGEKRGMRRSKRGNANQEERRGEKNEERKRWNLEHDEK